MLHILGIVDQLSFDFLLGLNVISLVPCRYRAFIARLLDLRFLEQRCLTWWSPVSIINAFLDRIKLSWPSFTKVIYHYFQCIRLRASSAVWRGIPGFRSLDCLVLSDVRAEYLTILRDFVKVYRGVTEGLVSRQGCLILQIKCAWQDGIGAIHCSSIDSKIQFLGPV